LEDVNNMQKLSNYLLKLNRLESDKTGFEMKNVDLKEIATLAIGKRKVKMDLKKTIILGDRDGIAELVSILLDNAFKYGDGKEVSVRVRNGEIKVKDNGVGISEKDIPYIFDKFYRGDKSRTKDGYGLGLSIAKSIVEKMNGKIKVESKVGKGSTFSVQFQTA
jgi:two-component system sensor histidine kinase ResE